MKFAETCYGDCMLEVGTSVCQEVEAHFDGLRSGTLLCSGKLDQVASVEKWAFAGPRSPKLCTVDFLRVFHSFVLDSNRCTPRSLVNPRKYLIAVFIATAKSTMAFSERFQLFSHVNGAEVDSSVGVIKVPANGSRFRGAQKCLWQGDRERGVWQGRLTLA